MNIFYGKDTALNIDGSGQERVGMVTSPGGRGRDAKWLGWILQGGVMCSAILVIVGLLLLPTRPGGLSVQRVLTFPHTVPQVLHDVCTLRPQAFIMLGLLILIFTPVIRVAASIVIFALERDITYILVTSCVLAMLLVSLFVVGNVESHMAVRVQGLQYSLAVMTFIFLGSVLAGMLGSLVGLGGGVLIVPLLTLVFHVPFDLAIGASIISVIATSSGAAAAYIRDHLTNVRLGMFLEIATTIGSVCGAVIAGWLAPGLLSIIFGIILCISAAPLLVKMGEELPKGVKNDRLANVLRLAGSYPDQRLGREVQYQVTQTPWGFGMMYIAGIISGLLGIGSGTFKVLALDTLMRIPIKVSSTTSNFMIGVTAAASAGIYFAREAIVPLLAAPVALGVLLGAFIGARILMRMSSQALRILFLLVMLISALQMIAHGAGWGIF